MYHIVYVNQVVDAIITAHNKHKWSKLFAMLITYVITCVLLYYRDLYFMPVSDFRSTTSQDPDKSCIESGIQHQSNQEQLKCACIMPRI